LHERKNKLQGLEIKPGQTLLIQGGASSIGLCAMEFAKHAGLKVISTTRSESKSEFPKKLGALDVIVDKGSVDPEVRQKYPEGVERILELIGTATLLDSLKALKRGGIGCLTEILGGEWELKNFSPMDGIPTAVNLTSYAGEASDISQAQLQKYVDMVEQGEMRVNSPKTLAFNELQEAPSPHELQSSRWKDSDNAIRMLERMDEKYIWKVSIESSVIVIYFYVIMRRYWVNHLN
jgi:NADPH:quinone reductase